jgi:hypothetical protein
MAVLTFTKADVARLLQLPNTEAVEGLIHSGSLAIVAYTVRGRPLFDAEGIRKAAAATMGKPILEEPDSR